MVLAEELHFGRAAARLHVSQPALSQQVRRLEQQLGLTLFDRSRHGVALSEAGRALLPAAAAVEEAASALAAVAAELAAGWRGTLRLGVSPGAHHAVDPLLAALPPGLEVHVRTEAAARLGRQVAAGELDAGLAFCTAPEPGLELEALHDARASVVVDRAHPLAARTRLALAMLRDERFALADQREAPGYNAAVLAACAAAGFTPRTSDPAGGPLAWERAIDGGCVGLSSASALHARAANVRLVRLEDEVRFTLFLIRPAGARGEGPVVRALRAAARQAAERGL